MQAFSSHVVLHFLNGRRRAGDIRIELDGSQEFALLVCSVDLAVSAGLGNMMSLTVVAIWSALLHDGRVTAFIAGPPAETWGAAIEQNNGGTASEQNETLGSWVLQSSNVIV